MTAFQQVKTISNTQVLSGRQSINNHGSSGCTFSPYSKKHECVPGRGSHWQLFEHPFLSSPNGNSVQSSDDGKVTHAAEATPRAPIHSPKTSLSQESHYCTADGQVRYREREQKCAALRRMPSVFTL